MKKAPVQMIYSDLTFGTQEWGFLPRSKVLECAEDRAEREDKRYEAYLKSLSIDARIVEGTIYFK